MLTVIYQALGQGFIYVAFGAFATLFLYAFLTHDGGEE